MHPASGLASSSDSESHAARRPLWSDLAANIHTRQIPVVVVTGSPEELGDRPVECVLTNPVMPEKLVETVRQCLQITRADTHHRSPMKKL